MALVVVGLNHLTAPVELRERLAMPAEGVARALAGLHTLDLQEVSATRPSPVLGEAVIVSTCNRLEVYASAPDADQGIAFIEQFLVASQVVPDADLKRHLYRGRDEATIDHLMRVACGLDSIIVGETQILGQITAAYEIAHRTGMTGPVLSHLFAQTIHTGKRARTESPISRHTTSISHAGVQLLTERLAAGCPARILLVGAGEMIVLAAQALVRSGTNELTIINRTFDRAQKLARESGAKALTWYQLEEALVWADAVICATSAPHTVILRQDLEAVLIRRVGRPLVIVDIAVPRDVEESVRTLPDVEYYDIDDLQSVIDVNVGRRKAAIPQVEAIIEQEVERYTEWYYGRQVTPVIRQLRDWAQSVADVEVEQALSRLPDADDRTRKTVSRLAHRLVNRFLHEPTTRLRHQAAAGNGQGYADAVRELFALDALEELASRCPEVDPSDPVAEGTPTAHCPLQCIAPPGANLQV